MSLHGRIDDIFSLHCPLCYTTYVSDSLTLFGFVKRKNAMLWAFVLIMMTIIAVSIAAPSN